MLLEKTQENIGGSHCRVNVSHSARAHDLDEDYGDDKKWAIASTYSKAMATSLLLATPKFGDQIDLLEEAENLSAARGKSVSEVLYLLFWIRYPHVTVGRPQILYIAAKRVAGPTCSSPRGARLNVEALQLLKECCAGYMRTDELKTVSLAHKATVIPKQKEGSLLHLNTDGTTLGQKKIDSAATQKKFNCLIEEQKETDMATCETNARESAIEIVENFCTIHLGFNLRKAFLIGVKSVFESKDNKDHSREYHQVNIFVHEFHKLFGKHGGTPE
uniref:Uncharacterized protein n=1 Tax=Amphimedon queenslandica TaxID=400682 RepID=A0A1X7V9H0_AMPQE